jgi:hypothetical protein
MSARTNFTPDLMQSYVGKKFGRVTVSSVSRVGDRRDVIAIGRCDCGNNVETRLTRLISNQTKSCGCLHIEVTKAVNSTHGHSTGYRRSRTMAAFHNMHTRCENKSSSRFPTYGGRGIYVDKAWFDYSTFLQDMGECPQNLTLGRIDNNGPYSKDNCIWESNSEQARNKTNTKWVTYRGETKCLMTWCDILNLTYGTINYRLTSGWPVDRAFETPVGTKRHST